MAIKKILTEGNPLLTKKCHAVSRFDEKLCLMLRDMADTLREAKGIGLAGPQVGIMRRIVVIDAGEGELLELINPQIISTEGEQTGPEACLSVPDQCGIVTRPMKVTLRTQNREGDFFEVTGEGLLARAFCHELDHLDGQLYLRLVKHFIDPEEDWEEEEEAIRAPEKGGNV